jgi:hypothetical protein
MNNLRNDIYYILKPYIPRKLQLLLRRSLVRYQLFKYRRIWPIDHSCSSKPQQWRGWPDGKKFALVITHDVDTQKGQDRCTDLMKIDETHGMRSSFNFVPLRYTVSRHIQKTLVDHGFEIGVHGLYHDGKYYSTSRTFLERSRKINEYLKEWNAVGYRAPAMDHRLECFHDLAIEYDTSTFDTDPFEPHAVGVGRIFPFLVTNGSLGKGYVELPYTMPQDFTLFILMRHDNIDIWKKKLDWIVDHGGMVLINTHPDYMNFRNGKTTCEEYPVHYYEGLINYIKTKYEGQYWHALPRDVARFWRKNYDTR